MAEAMGVLVGVDGSACAEEALRWAVADAAARGVPLTVAGVVDLPRLAEVPLSAELVAAAERAGRRTVERSAAHARGIAPQVPVRTVVTTGDPAAELLRHAGAAAEVVVGSHGRGGLAALLVGSVSAKVAEHAPGAAVVVRALGSADGRVVVGVDGSERSDAALEYGFAYADRHHLPLTALHVHSLATTYRGMSYGLPAYPVGEELARLRERGVATTRGSVGPWTEKYPDVPVRVDVVEGSPAHRLVEAGRDAALVVVGTRGHGGLAGMLLGSVSHAVSRHAHGPVALVREDRP